MERCAKSTGIVGAWLHPAGVAWRGCSNVPGYSVNLFGWLVFFRGASKMVVLLLVPRFLIRTHQRRVPTQIVVSGLEIATTLVCAVKHMFCLLPLRVASLGLLKA